MRSYRNSKWEDVMRSHRNSRWEDVYEISS